MILSIKYVYKFWFKQKRIEKYWSMLKPKIPEYFKGLDIKPTLLHGDFWEGNIALYKSKPSSVFVLYILYSERNG